MARLAVVLSIINQRPYRTGEYLRRSAHVDSAFREDGIPFGSVEVDFHDVSVSH